MNCRYLRYLTVKKNFENGCHLFETLKLKDLLDEVRSKYI